MFDAKRPITRARDARMLGGVLGGMAQWLECDPSVVRVAYILVTAFTGFLLGVVAYGMLWAFLPVAPLPSEVQPAPRPTTP